MSSERTNAATKKSETYRSPTTLRLFTLNLGGPSQSRAEELWTYLDTVDADVLVLTETRGTPGTAELLGRFRQLGYTVRSAPNLERSERGVAVVHRTTGEPEMASDRVDLSHRLQIATLNTAPRLTIVGVYVPSRDASPQKIRRKKTFLEQLNRLLAAISTDRYVVLMGDFNIVSRRHEPRYSAFRAWEYDALDDISRAGFRDGFLELHPEVQAHSWIGRTGNGYRYDYAFLSSSLVAHLVACDYIHEPRKLGLSDHAGVQLTIDTAGLERTATFDAAVVA